MPYLSRNATPPRVTLNSEPLLGSRVYGSKVEPHFISIRPEIELKVSEIRYGREIAMPRDNNETVEHK